jgi:hypothetical protein
MVWNLGRQCDFVTDTAAPFAYPVDKFVNMFKKGVTEMNPFVKFMVSPAGRIIRIVAGIALIAWAFLGLSGAATIAVAVVGLVPLLAGVFDFCVFAPLFGGHLSGPKNRAVQG